MGANTLLVAYSFPPSPEPGALRPGRFYKYLTRYGYRPLVVTSTPQDARHPPEGVHCIETVVRPTLSAEGFADRILTRLVIAVDRGELRWVRDALAAALETHRRSGFTSVISTFPPLGAHLVGLHLARKLGVKWIADFRDPLGDNPYRAERPVCALLDRRIERQIFKHADLLVANTDAALDSWKRRYPQHAGKMRLIWNGFDPATPVEALPLPRRDHRVIGHFGEIYGERHPGLLLESLERLITSGQLDPAAVRIVQQGPVAGSFDNYARLREQLHGRGVWVENTTVVSREEAQRLQCQADALLLLDTPGARPSQVPSKLFEYARVGRPILALTMQGSPVDRLLEESGIPNVRVHYGTPPAEIDARLNAFLRLPTDPVPMSSSFAEKFDGERQTRYLAELLDGLLGQSN